MMSSIKQTQKRSDNFNKNLLNLNYKINKKDPRIKTLSKELDLVDISRLSGVSYPKLKKLYNQGLSLLNHLISAYNLIVEYENQNLENYIRINKIEKLWLENCKYYKYIPYIGVEEFAILHKYNRKLLESLKSINRSKEKNIDE